jgi:hypothetical protein
MAQTVGRMTLLGGEQSVNQPPVDGVVHGTDCVLHSLYEFVFIGFPEYFMIVHDIRVGAGGVGYRIAELDVGFHVLMVLDFGIV